MSVLASCAPGFGSKSNVDRDLALDTQQLTQDAAGLVEETKTILLWHDNDPTERSEQSDELIGCECDVPGLRSMLGLIEGNAIWNGETERRPVSFALDERGELSLVKVGLSS